MNESNVRETKDKILDATERLVATHGISGTSLRQITNEANVNLASVNYHFQTKDELMRSVYLRRLEPMNKERLALLDELEATWKNEPIPLAEILYAFFEPVVNLADQMNRKGIPFGAILGRIFTEPDESISAGFMKEMAPVGRRFASVIHKVLPHLSVEDVFWRMWFTIGIISHAMGTAPKLEMLSQGRCSVSNRPELMRQMIAYAKAGLEAPK